ncbi:MAG: hypothetical protein ABIR32_07240 [Ilumatobacteraceae bacterium]
MSDATLTSISTPDPSMDRLAPRPSRARNRLLVLVGVFILVAAAFSPNLLRPSLSPPNGNQSGSWSALPSHREVLTTASVAAQTWPRLALRSVIAVPGARVVGAWIVEESVAAALDGTVDESYYETGLEYLAAAMPGLDLEGDALPKSLDHGDTASLIILWDVDACDELVANPDVSAALEARTAVRTSRTVDLPDFAAPGFDIDLLRRSGICP